MLSLLGALMNYYFLLISLVVSSLFAMEQEEAILVEESAQVDTSTLVLPLETRVTALRLVMLNRLEEKDYTAVTHLIEKTALHPGENCVALFERGGIRYTHIKNKIGGSVYFLYEAAFDEDHQRALQLLEDEGCLVQVYLYAAKAFRDQANEALRYHLVKNLHFDEQCQKYENLVFAQNTEKTPYNQWFKLPDKFFFAKMRSTEIPRRDTSVQTLPVEARVQALRIVMVHRLMNHDYRAVTHLLEKTKLHPGEEFVSHFERGGLTKKEALTNSKCSVVYNLYLEALGCSWEGPSRGERAPPSIKEPHKRAIQLLDDEGCLAQVYLYGILALGSKYVRKDLRKNPHFDEQYQQYEDIVFAQYNSFLIQEGKKPLTKEEWREPSVWKTRREWSDKSTEIEEQRFMGPPFYVIKDDEDFC